MSNDLILISILLSFNLFAFATGYIIGKLGCCHETVHPKHPEKMESFFAKEKSVKKNVNIDSSKVVTNINTQGLEKKYTDLGETKQSTENISSSINKLKDMKG